MSEQLLYRATLADLEARGRTVHGLAVPFDRPTRVSNASEGTFDEVFRRGAFAKTIGERGASRVKFMLNHDHKRLPIGRALTLREDPAGLYAELRVSQTQDGDEALTLITDGTLDGLSIGFQPVPGGDRWSRSRTSVERLEVKLREVSAVAFPSYESALISGVRSAQRTLSHDAALARLRLLQRNPTP